MVNTERVNIKLANINSSNSFMIEVKKNAVKAEAKKEWNTAKKEFIELNGDTKNDNYDSYLSEYTTKTTAFEKAKEATKKATNDLEKVEKNKTKITESKAKAVKILQEYNTNIEEYYKLCNATSKLNDILNTKKLEQTATNDACNNPKSIDESIKDAEQAIKDLQKENTNKIEVLNQAQLITLAKQELAKAEEDVKNKEIEVANKKNSY